MGGANNLAHFFDMTYNFKSKQTDYALYLPALQDAYVAIGGGHGIPQQRTGVTGEWFNFLNPIDSAFYYPFALYSAGVGLRSNRNRKQMLSNRSSDTFILTDSGGHQLTKDNAKEYINFSSPRDVENMTEEILDWQLEFGDRGVIIDVPPKAVRPDDPSCPFQTFRHCLDQTVANIIAFKKLLNERGSNHPFMNVIQGENEQDNDAWYEAVRPYDLQGWAFGAVINTNYYLLIRMLIKMRDNGDLDPAKKQNWIHIFGKAKVRDSLVLTQIQRCLRQRFEDFTVTFDTSSYSLATGKSGAVAMSNPDDHVTIDPPKDPFSLVNIRGPMKPNPKAVQIQYDPVDIAERARQRVLSNQDTDPETGEKIQFFEDTMSPLMDDLDVTDFIVSWATKDGKGWDAVSRATVGLHNLYITLRAIQGANFDYSVGSGTGLAGKSNKFKGTNLDPIYDDVHHMNGIIEDIFNDPNPMQLLSTHKVYLENY